MAGESAREFARRQRDKAERHARMAARYERGAEGEEATAAMLGGLQSEGWLMLHDVAWPGRPRANLDHVVVGPGGVLVVDTKNWSGTITAEHGVLRQNGRRRPHVTSALVEASSAVSGLLGGMPVCGVLCFVGTGPVSGWHDGVALCSTVNIADFLRSRPPTLHPQAVARVHQHLRQALPPATRPSQSPVRSPRAVPSLGRRGRRARFLRARSGPVARRTSARRRRGRREPSLGRLVLVLAITVGALAFGKPLLQATASLVSERITSVVSPTHDLGETAQIPATTRRPALEVTVDSVRPTKSAVGERVRRGHRLVAVQVGFHNAGDSAWQLNPNSARVMVWGDGRWYAPAARFTKTLARRQLPRQRMLAPGQQVAGEMLFEVPDDMTIQKVRVRVGPVLSRSFSWNLDESAGR